MWGGLFNVFDNGLYAKAIGNKVRVGIRQMRKTCLIVTLPTGYYKDKNTGEALMDETAAEIVREELQ